MIKRFYILLLAIVASVGMSWATTTDLASISDNYTAQDGEILTGTLGVNVKISIADGATVTLLNANINGDKTWTTGDYAGLTCLGDATITIVGKNSVSGFSVDNGYPGIYVPSGKTLIINGTGSLTAESSAGDGAGIGAGKDTDCGNIEIQSGKITAKTLERGAGIGGAYNASCGNITISGGIVTAVGGDHCSGIGGAKRRSGYDAGHCGNILISGGVVSATSGAHAAAIGGGRGVNVNYLSNCGTITITNTALKVYADQGGSSTNTIGAGKYGNCGTVTIGGNTGVINNDPYTYRTKEDGEIVVVYINAIGTVVYTQECKDKIDIARELYDALEDSQKTLVTNYQTLLDAEAAYAALTPAAPATDPIVISTNTGQSSYTQGDITITCSKPGTDSDGFYLQESGNETATITNSGSSTISQIELEIGWFPQNRSYVRANGAEPTSSDQYSITFSNVNSNNVTLTITNEKIQIRNVTITLADEGGSTNPSGSCGTNLSWEFNPATGTLTITGSGAMTDWASASSRPWHSYQSDITSLSLPEGLTFIGRSAFQECQMTSVELPNSLEEIGRAAFCACGLTSVTIPDNVQTIGQSAFASCQNLSTITIGSGVTSIGYFAFSNLMIEPLPSRKLESVTCYATNPPTCGYDESFTELLDKEQVPLYVPAESVDAYKAAEDWKDFDVQAISGGSTPTTWTSLSVGDVIKVGDKIEVPAEGDGSWGINGNVLRNTWGPYELIRADIYQASEFDDPVVTEDANGAFYVFKAENSTFYPFSNVAKGGALVVTGTSDGLEVTAAENKEFTVAVHEGGGSTTPSWVLAGDAWDEDTKTLTVNSNPGSEAYYQNTEIEHVIFGDAVTSIGEMSFWGCSNMTTAEIGNSVQTIENNAFRESGLVTVTIGNGLTSIDYFAFCNCESLTTLTCEAVDPPTLGGTGAFTGTYNLLDIYVPAGSVDAYKSAWTEKSPYIKAIGSGGGSTPANVCGDGLTWELKDGALTISYTGTGTGVMDNYASRSDAPWYSYKDDITSVTITDGVTSVGSNSFGYYENLVTVTIGNDVETIGEYAFGDCYKFTTLNLGNSIKHIGDRAFMWAKVLTGFTLPSTLETIGEYAFLQNKLITSLTIPSNVTSIGPSAFMYCAALTSVTVEATTPPTLGETVFDGVPTSIPLYVPFGSVAAYKAADQWKAFDIQGSDPVPADVITLIEAIGTVELTAECKAKIDAARAAFIALSDGDKDLVTNIATLTTAEAAFDNVMDIWLSGDCDAILWKDTTLTVRKHAGEGNGAMADYTSYYGSNTAPWYNSHWYNPQPGDIVIKSVTIEEGVTRIGENAFGWMSELKTVTIPSSMASIGEDAFYWSKAVDDIYLTVADPSNLTWVLPYSADNQFKPSKATLCHVPADLLTAYQETFGTLNMTFVGDLAPVTPLTPEEQAAIDAVKSKIDAIPQPVVYTEACKAAIDSARAAYDALATDVMKLLVDNYDVLTAAEATYESLKDVVVVEAKINAIPQPVELKLATRDSINNARAAYDALTADQKPLVSNYQDLLDAEDALAALNPGGGAPSTELQGDGSTENPYLIGGLEAWNAFADAVAAGVKPANAKLTNNIEGVTRMVGNFTNYYTGVFDGNGFTITMNIETNLDSAGLFRCVKEATFMNLNLEGTFTTSRKFAGSLVGAQLSINTLVIKNVCSSVAMTLSGDGDLTSGGIVGLRLGKIQITDCLFKGSMTSTGSGSMCGGIVGYSSSNLTLVRVIQAGTYNLNTSSYDGVFVRNNDANLNAQNCYYINGVGGQSTCDAATKITTDQLNTQTYVDLLQTGKEETYWVLKDGVLVWNHHETSSPSLLDSAQAVKELIEAIPMPVTLEDACVNAIQAARDAYNALADAAKGALDDATVQKLTDAEAALTALNQAVANEVIAKINNIPLPVELKLATRDSIQNARTAYDALNAAQQALVTNYTKLTDAEAALDELNKGGSTPVDIVWDGNTGIANVSPTTTSPAYEGMTVTVGQGSSFSTYQSRLYFTFNSQPNGGFIFANENGTNITKVVIESTSALTSTMTEVDRMGSGWVISNENKTATWTGNADSVSIWKGEHFANYWVVDMITFTVNGTATPLDSAQAVKDLIDAIPTPVEYPTSGPAIAAALVAYQQLSDAAKGALDDADVQKMTDAATQYAALDAIAAIEAIPAEIVYDPAVKAAIETAREKYDALIDASKALVDAEVVAKLTNAEQAWADLVALIEHTVTYIGKDGELKNENVALLHIPNPAPDFNGHEFVRWDVKAGDFLEEGLRIKAVYTPIITTNPAAYDSLMYNGTAQTLITAGVAKEGHIEYSLYPEEPESWSANLPTATNAGVYAVSYKLVREGHEDYMAGSVTAVIAKAPVTYVVPQAYDTLAYNYNTQVLVTAGQTNDGIFEYGFDPTLPDSWSADLPQAMNAGTYNVYFRVNGDMNHLDSTAVDPIAVTIAKAELIATADDKDVIYGNQAPQYTVTYAGWQGDDDAAVLTGDIAFACDYNDTTSVGTYPIVPSGVDAANYTISFVNGTLTVAKAESGCTAPVVYDTLVYNGANQTLIIAGQPMGGEMQYSLDTTVLDCWSNSLPQAKDAGTYNVYYRVKGDMNHNDHYYDLITVSIAKAALTATAEDKTVTYGDQAPEYTVVYAGWHGTDDASVLTGAIAYACDYLPTSNVDEYTITPSGVDAANYIITFVNGKVTVGKAALMITAEDKNVIYGDAVPTYTATYSGWKNSDDASVVSNLAYTCEYAPTSNVGEYAIVPSGAEALNYAISYTNGKVTVSKAVLTITANDTVMIYGDEAPAFTASYSGWLNGDDESLVSGLAFTTPYQPGSPVGTYAIHPVDATAQNYRIAFADGALVVNKAVVSVSGAEAHTAKFADGHANAEVTNQGVLNGVKLNDPLTHVTTAVFSSAEVSEHLTITLFYELTGDAALLANYDLQPTSEVFTTEGVIIEPFLPNNDDDPEDKESKVQEGIEVYAYGYCEGDNVGLKYHLNSGNPDQYMIEFEDSRFADVDWTPLDEKSPEGVIYITVPVDVPTGDYKMTVTFRDSRFAWLESQPLNVTFHVNLPETYVRPLFDNTIVLVDTCECFTDIQWYHRADSAEQWQPISGANGHYLHVEGKLTGEYFVKAKMNGVETYTCEQTDMQTLYGAGDKKQAIVRAYPNPVIDNTNVTIENSEAWEHNLRIVNLMGVELENTTFEGDHTVVEMSGYPQGNYMISVDGIMVKVLKQ